jgi:hypothetical protein
MAQAESSLDLLAQQIREANTPPGTITKGLPFSEQHIKFEPGGKGISLLRKRFAAPLKLLMAVVALVLVIACANIAGLLLARGVTRRKEMAIRLSLGANSWRVVRQLLTESSLLAVAGGLAGLLIAPWLISLLVKTQPRLDLARSVLAHGIDKRVLAFTALTTVLAGLVFGPLWGTVYTSIASTAGACLAFLLARYAARGVVARWMEPYPALGRIDRAVARHGARIVMITRLDQPKIEQKKTKIRLVAKMQ